MRGKIPVILTVVFAAFAVCLIPGMYHGVQAQAKTQGLTVSLTPSDPAFDNNDPNEYGYYNAASEIAVDIRIRSQGDGDGIRKVEYWITDGTNQAGSQMQAKVLYEDPYVEEPEEEAPGTEEPEEEPEEPEEEEEESDEGEEAGEEEEEEAGGSEDPEGQADSEAPEGDGDPGESGEPEEEEEPEEPEEPGEPEEPEEPEEPGEPEEPEEPDQPGQEKEPHVYADFWEGRITVDPSRWHTCDVRVHVRTTDTQGNRREDEVRLDIDTAAPVITVSYDNNQPFLGSCYGKARTATIKITEKHFDPGRVHIAVTNSEGSVPAVSEWTKSGTTGASGEDTVYTGVLIFEEDGDYTFSIDLTDAAGNSASGVRFAKNTADAQAFTIDRTEPRVTVSFDNNEAENGCYFHAPRTATVVVSERNFDPDLVDLGLSAEADGEERKSPSVSWSHNGDIHTASIPFTEEGNYTLEVAVTDRAGNKSGDPDFGDCAAASAFVIDRQEPEVRITGVDDSHGYRGEVAPGIEISDSNFSKYEISLTRTRLDEVDADVTDCFFPAQELGARGGTILCETFERTRENDGVYTLRARAADLAGNEAESTVMFSVNRFGSVYVFSDYLISLIRNGGVYTQEVEEDLMVTEYNADRLVSDAFFLDVTRDGKPVTDVDWNLSRGMTGVSAAGSRGWYRYRYVIDRDNFAKDGVYKMSLSSKDEAGNTPDNAGATGMDILFRVDATAPEVDGSEKDGEDFQYTAFDTMGLASLEVYVDDVLFGERITDFGEDVSRFSGTVALGEHDSEHVIRLVAADLAGNITDEDFTVPVREQSIRELLASPAAALEQMAGRGILVPCLAGASAAAVVILIILLIRKRERREEKKAK